jgi:hypothetical protein
MSLGRPRRRWKDDTKMYVRYTEWNGWNWTGEAQNRQVLLNKLIKQGYGLLGC